MAKDRNPLHDSVFGAPHKPPEVEISGFTLPANVRMPNAASGCMLGNDFSNGMNTSGIVKRMAYIGNGVIRMWIGDEMRPCLVFSTGMVAEEKVG